MRRRILLYISGGMVCAWAFNRARAHTLFNQWVVYRQKHLLIGSHRKDLYTYQLANEVVTILDDSLPAAKARVARAPTPGRIASLLGTAQMDVAIVEDKQAKLMAGGLGDFKPYGKIDLTTLFCFKNYALVGRADIPEKHAWLITHALTASTVNKLDQMKPPLPWHKGTLLYLSGETLPEKPLQN